MTALRTLESPFGRLSSDLLTGGPPARARGSRKQKRAARAASTPIPVVMVVDPSTAVLRLVEGWCFQRHPDLCAITQWHVPGGPTHTRLLFFLREPEDALQLLLEAAHAESETRFTPLGPAGTTGVRRVQPQYGKK